MNAKHEDMARAMRGVKKATGQLEMVEVGWGRSLPAGFSLDVTPHSVKMQEELGKLKAVNGELRELKKNAAAVKVSIVY